MKFIYGKNDWADRDRGQENCYLLANGLGGYSSMTMLGTVTRNDHALLMACTKAPVERYHMITRTEEYVQFGEKKISLSAQEHVNYTKNQLGFEKLNQFSYEHFPCWVYQAEGVEVRKTIVMRRGANTIGIKFEIDNRMDVEADFVVIPQLQFVTKGVSISTDQVFQMTEQKIVSNQLELYYKTNGKIRVYDTRYVEDLYYSHDARDGRDSIGKVAYNHSIHFTVPPHQEAVGYLIYSMEPIDITFEKMAMDEMDREKEILDRSLLTDKIGRQLVHSADQFIVDRASTKGKSIIAGYPFFTDWGRDTMISMVGCCIATRRFEEAKSIFRTFIKYCRKGLMPNMFPEKGEEPIYNTVDASLLFIGAVYEFYLESEDLQFVEEAYPVLENIFKWYQKGTDFHIRMDNDGLILAGSGDEQVTWMDVRYGDILPTPRHGKPVEINAYWYNSLMIMDFFSRLLDKENRQFLTLADKVKKSFNEVFWNEKKGCLKDVVSGERVDEQIRCNQIWAVSLPFTMLSQWQEKMVVDKVYEKLYTPYGLRTLDMEDADFKPKYGGSHYERDMAYHQGTVWAFPLGGYYLAYLKVHQYSEKAFHKVYEQLSVMEACLREGCIGQIAEIYDGDYPTRSQGCFAQAWSVSEILKVYALLDKTKKKQL